jgi:multidrug efflux system membrane fusion protein
MDDKSPQFAALDADGRRTQSRTRSSLWRRLLILLVILLVALGLFWWLKPGANDAPTRAGRFGPNGPTPVVAAAAVKGDMPVLLDALGTVTPLATVTVKTQIDGNITQIGFTEGQEVKRGDFLVQIDPRPYQVALEQAQGTLARDQALLAEARVDLKRYATLVAQDSIAEQQLDTQRSLVAQYAGTIETDQGQVDSAKLNLAYCHIVAPVTGRLGLRLVDLGNYVTPGDSTGIVVITQLKPITVVFTLPEDNLPAVLKRMHGNTPLPVTAYDRSHTTKLATGTLATIDNEIDTTTGTVKLKASFPNDDESLFPNQFVNVELLLDTEHEATLVPVAAVQHGAPGAFVYLVNEAGDTVSIRPVTLGPGDADNIVVEKGLAVGDKVVTDGTDKLRDGAKITLPGNRPAASGGPPDAPRHGHRHAADGASGSPAPQ